MSTTDTDTDTERNPFTRKRFILGVALLAVVALAGGILSAILWFDSQRAPLDTTTAACERPASQDTRLAGALAVDGWDLIGASNLPMTPFGPATTRDGSPSCFEHSPAGAATAAAHMATLGSNGQLRTVLEDMSVDSRATDAFLTQLPATEPAPTFAVQPVAVRLADYDGDTATVTVVTTTEAGYRAGDFQLVWEDGDWLWDTPTEGINVTVPSSLSGYNRIPQPEETPNG